MAIPQPRTIPLLGNIRDIDLEYPLGSIINLANKYGPMYRLSIGGTTFVVVSSYEFVHEVCDDTRFQKSIKGELEELRSVVHDGLFTSKGEAEENWGVAHRVLMSAFGPMAIRGMFDEMHEIASQMALKWARFGPSEPIDIGEDFTRLTLDTVALCSMGFRFNSYYREKMHPFIEAMYAVLKEAGDKTMRILPSSLHRSADRKFRSNINLLRSTANEVLQARRATESPGHQTETRTEGRQGILDAMLNGVDPKTGRKMTDQSIIDNLITFLVAGHETTASTLTFTLYQLAKNPDVLRELQEEINTVVADGPVRVDHVGKLKYLTAVIRETLRFNAPIPMFAREAITDETIGGRYKLRAGEQIVCLLAKSHLDPAVFGADAASFNPTKMLDDNFNRLMKEFPHCWSPFGTGLRSCIGRPFAWQEMVLCLAVLVQNFHLVLDNPAYALRVQQTLTIKPKGLRVRAIPRGGITPAQLEARLAGSFTASSVSHHPSTEGNNDGSSARGTNQETDYKGRLEIFYGSDSGTCQFMAQRLASDAASHGFNAAVDILDVAKETLSTSGPVVVITSSYEGQPPHNAAHFVNWIQNTEDKLDGVNYAVYGCGHSDWVKSYQRIPQLVDSSLERIGAHRLASIGSTDAKDRDMFSDFENWCDQVFWPAIENKYGVFAPDGDAGISNLAITISSPRAGVLHQDVQEALVVSSRPLVAEDAGAVKRHIELELPPNMTYSAGDYLAVLPHNTKDTVSRAIRHFKLSWDSHVTIAAAPSTALPTGTSMPVSSLLSSYVELGQPATKRNVMALEQFAGDDGTSETLHRLATEAYDSDVRAKHVSILDIIEQFPSLTLPFDEFLLLLPPMRVRQYSISSSPLSNPRIATLTYAVVNEPALSGRGRHIGVSSSYLSSLDPGDRLHVSIRGSQGGFRLPSDPEKTPIICVAAGTGIAPFRAFLQERAMVMVGSGSQTPPTLAPAVLFYGCRRQAEDDLYREQLDEWEASGVVTVLRAYSRDPQDASGCRYVQDRIWHDRDTVTKLWDKDAKIYVCGSNKMADGVRDTFIRLIVATGAQRGEPMEEEQASAWFDSVRNERYVTDVFD